MARTMSPISVVVTALGAGYRLNVSYDVDSEGLGPALAELGPEVTVSFMRATEAAEHSCGDGAQPAPSKNDRMPANEIRRDSRGRMKLEPFLRYIARRGGLDWTDRVGVADAAGLLGWEVSAKPEATAGKVLARLCEEEPAVSWIQRRGGPRSREYKILPQSSAGGGSG